MDLDTTRNHSERYTYSSSAMFHKKIKPLKVVEPSVEINSTADAGITEYKGDEAPSQTPMEVSNTTNAMIEDVKRLIRVVSIEDTAIRPDCTYKDNLNKVLWALGTSIVERSGNFNEDVTYEAIEVYRSEACKLVADSNVLNVCCDMVVQGYDKYRKEDYFRSDSVSACLNLIMNFTDKSDEILVKVVNYPLFLETLKAALQELTTLFFSGTETDMPEVDAIETVIDHLGIIHNLALSDSSIARLRSLDFTRVVQPYLDIKPADKEIQMIALSALAGIVNEKESEIINANRKPVKILLRNLKKGLKTQLRRYEGWSCKEVARVLRMLARNDANKQLLVELGALELLVKLGKIGNEAEKTESTGAIWVLCFDADNRAMVSSQEALGVVDLLSQLSRSAQKGVRANCKGALWTLREELKKSCVKRYQEIAEAVPRPKKRKIKKGCGVEADTDDGRGHVMISYQWGDQQTMKTIVERLKANKYKVWIDIEKMGGSTLEAMAQAIEQADVVLICYSQKYKDSPNCRAEAEYAFQQRKQCIPLKMERGYNPDGWLGIIIGTKLFYEFSPKYPFEEKINAVLQRLAELYRRNSTQGKQLQAEPVKAHTVKPVSERRDDVDSPAYGQTQNVAMTTAVPPLTMATAEKLRKWGEEDVKHWVQENSLSGCHMDQLTGGEIGLLLCMRCEAPEFFYKTLRKRLKVNNLLTMSKIVWALKDLTIK